MNDLVAKLQQAGKIDNFLAFCVYGEHFLIFHHNFLTVVCHSTLVVDRGLNWVQRVKWIF